MRVKIEFSLDVDEEAWALDYGIEGGADVRADVKVLVEETAKEHLRSLGLLKEDS